MSKPDEYLDRLLTRLTNECLNGLVHYQNWKLLNDFFRDQPEVAETAGAFFESTAHAHIDSATLRLYRLIDKTKGAVSIYTLLRFAKRNPGAFKAGTESDVTAAVEKAESLLAEVEGLLDHFQEQRNGYFVHISGAYFSEPARSVTEEYPVTFRDVYDSFVLVGKMLNAFRAPHSDSETLMEVFGVEDAFRSLVLHLEVGKRYEWEDYQRRRRAV